MKKYTNHRDFLNHKDYLEVYNEAIEDFKNNCLAWLSKERYSPEEVINTVAEMLTYEIEEDN